MTYSKLPGVYFSETVESGQVDSTKEYAPLFITKSSSSIPQLDDQIVYFEGLSSFVSIATQKGLGKTMNAMKVILNTYGSEKFYVYNIATDTSASMVSILEESAMKEDIIDVIFIEDSKSANANSINSKTKAIQTALHDNFENGTFRTAIIVPFGTVHDAVTNKGENATVSGTVISSLASCFDGVTDGRIFGVVPDDTLMASTVAQIIKTPFYAECGYETIEITGVPEYEFTMSEMITLQNMGLCFLRKQTRNGVDNYRINLGVTTSFANSDADGLIKSRRICDEALRQIKAECDNVVKSEDVETSDAIIQTAINTILSDFIEQKYMLSSITVDGVKYSTKLTATVGDRFTINVNGYLIPTGSLIAINVNTTIE